MSETKKVIPLCVPNISGNEWKYVKDCLDTGWISSVGSYVTDFENSVAKYVGAKHAVAVVNGTSALHICMKVGGVVRGDYVIIPNITFVATANSVMYAEAEPLLVDADPETWQMDLDLLEQFLESQTHMDGNGDCILTKTKRRIKAIMPVHVQGNIGDVHRLLDIAAKYNLLTVEDSTESLGSTYKNEHAGTFARMGCFSFNGNKVISTGGGGMIVTDDQELAKMAKHITTTAKTDPLAYFHDQVGYNYRLVNVLAAMGVAQMEQLDGFIKRKKEIGDYYRSHLTGVADISFQKINPEVSYNNWLFTIKTKHQKELLTYLNSEKVISRPFWMPMNKLPMYKDCIYVTEHDNADEILNTCLAIPCSSGITEGELERVVSTIKSFFQDKV